MRSVSTLALLLAAGTLLLGAAAPAASSNLDLVVMVDTSESTFPYFDDLVNTVIQDLLLQRLHKGDTFHLLSFSSMPEVEIALSIDSTEESQRAFSRILLLHALGRYTDLVAALSFLGQYTHELPETNRKQILLITDGVHAPPPGSPNQGTEVDVGRAVDAAVATMAGQGWTFDILRVPPEPSTGGPKSYLPQIAAALGAPIIPYSAVDVHDMAGRATGFPDLVFPPSLGKVAARFSAPFKVRNWKTEPIMVTLTGVQSDGVELLERPVSLTVPASSVAQLDVPLRLPSSYPVGDHAAAVRLVFGDDLRISPSTGTLSFMFTGKGGFPLPRLTFLYVIYILLGIGLVYLLARLFLLMRHRLSEESLVAGPRRSASRGRVAASPARKPPARRLPASPAGHVAPQPAPAQAVPAARPPRRQASPRLSRPTVTSLKRSLPREEMQRPNLPPLIEMRVSFQSHAIGFRNVHRIADGSSRTIGGRSSAYLIFLVALPPAVAEIRNEGGSYVFTPLKTELFPGIQGPVRDCLNREITLVAPKGREMTLHFREWKEPLDEINGILRRDVD